MKRPLEGVVFSAHKGTDRENVGDVLSAKAIIALRNSPSAALFVLPEDIGKSKDLEVVYGGGGMIRPLFQKREIYQDYLQRSGRIPYEIYGVGVNFDILAPRISESDMEAIHNWLAHASRVSVRDVATKDFISGNFKDISIFLEPCPTYSVLCELKKDKPNKKFAVGISVSFGHTTTYLSYLDRITGMIRDLSDTLGKDRISLICHDGADFKYAEKEFPNIYRCEPKSFLAVGDEYQKCEGIISLRGHGVIFAAALGLPCSPIPLCDKISSLYEYHYGQTSQPLSFDAEAHVGNLQKTVYPLNLISQ